MTAEEHEAARWLSECVANMKAKLNLSTGQVIATLRAEDKREKGVLALEKGVDT